MVFNNVTNALRKWCRERNRQYAEESGQEQAGLGQRWGSVSSWRAIAELDYKLGTLIDQEFPSFEAYCHGVRELMSLRIDPVLKAKTGKIDAWYIQRAESAFLEYLNSLTENCPMPDVPFSRIIRGSEAVGIGERFYEAWKYDTSYWYPLRQMPGEEMLFLPAHRMEPYREAIRKILGLPGKHIYEYGEGMYAEPYCAEVTELGDYSGFECAFCPKDFSWILYFSHENTVTFAGTIVPGIKEILLPEREYWNRFEWDC